MQNSKKRQREEEEEEVENHIDNQELIPDALSDDEEKNEKEEKEKNDDSVEARKQSFRDLGLMEALCEACIALSYKKPTKIQKEAIPFALQGKRFTFKMIVE